MNPSNFAHALVALLMQSMTALIATAFGADFVSAVVMGALFAVGFYFGREVAQAERKLGTPPWWSGFIVTKWSRDAIFDLLFPVIACGFVAIVVSAL